MAFYANSGGNRQDWQAQTFLMSVVDKDSGFSFLNKRMKPIVVIVESLHHVWLCNPWTVPYQAPLSSNISQSLLKFTSIESVMPSTISSSAALFSFCPQTFPASGSFLVSQLISSAPKYWSFSFSNSPSNKYSGLISFRTDKFDLLAVQGTLKSLFYYHNSKASILWCSAFFTVQLYLKHAWHEDPVWGYMKNVQQNAWHSVST